MPLYAIEYTVTMICTGSSTPVDDVAKMSCPPSRNRGEDSRPSVAYWISVVAADVRSYGLPIILGRSSFTAQISTPKVFLGAKGTTRLAHFSSTMHFPL